jgi:uncharacterized membrane protein
VSDHDDDQLVADYLRRLTVAASALPADRRAELIEEITAHIAEARTAGAGGAAGGSPSVPDILERLGDPGQIVQAAAEPSFGELAGPPEPRPSAPSASVRNAVRLMYLGAAVSLIKVIVDLATEGATRSAMLTALKAGAKKSGVSATVSQLNSGITNTLILAFVLGVIGVGLWILVARASSSGKDWARVTGSVLFGLDTLALLIGPPDVGIRGAEITVTRIFAGIIWLIGLAAVVFLWQRDSTVFFRALAPHGGGRESGHPANLP